MIVKTAFGMIAGRIDSFDKNFSVASLLISEGDKGKIYQGVIKKSRMAGEKCITDLNTALGTAFRGAKNYQTGPALIDVMGPTQHLYLGRTGVNHHRLFYISLVAFPPISP